MKLVTVNSKLGFSIGNLFFKMVNILFHEIHIYIAFKVFQRYPELNFFANCYL